MSPKERSQATYLVLATLLILSVGFFWVRSILAGNQITPVAEQATAPAPAASNPAPAATGQPAASAPLTAAKPGPSTQPVADNARPVQIAMGTDQNPFKKVISDAPTSGGSSSSSGSAPLSGPALANKVIDEQRRKQFDVPGPGGSLEGNLPGVKPLQPGAGAMNDAFRLMGIIADAKGATALVSYGGNMVYVRKGQKISDLRVANISRSTMTLASKKSSYTIEVGGSLGSALGG